VIVTVNGEPAPVHSSVAVVKAVSKPPKANADACVPAPAKALLAVFKLPGEVAQLVPSYSSVAPVLFGGEPGLPPKPKPAV
jgi:hypothetical protein